MKPYRGTLLASAVLLSLLPLSGCGDAEDWTGTDPSGSHIRVVKVSPTTLEPDIFRSVCEDGAYEPGITNSYVTVSLKNESTPNTPSGESTNSYVTMNRYRVDYIGVSKTVEIPAIEGGQSVGLPPGGESTMTVLVMDFARLQYISDHYPSIGRGESLTLRAKITLWGEDAFKERVSTEAEVTLVVTDYDRCSTDTE